MTIALVLGVTDFRYDKPTRIVPPNVFAGAPAMIVRLKNTKKIAQGKYRMRLIIGISGSSGAIYGIRLLEMLREVPDVETHLVMSRYGRLNIELETDYKINEVEDLANVVHNERNQAASISSGSFGVDGMIVAPCSMKTLSAIANSYADGLLVRAADVCLKEHKKLVLMPRESPLHTGHCKLLYEVSKLGAIIAPPMPAFYNKPKTLDDLVNHSVGRVLDLFGLETDQVKRWSGVVPD
jgi:4-hydroxy-3-polyprenylbenzoate decarboxylase